MNVEKVSDGIKFIRDNDNPYNKVYIPEELDYVTSGIITEDYEIEKINISEILKEKYPDIYQSALENDYTIDDDEECFYFFATPDENEEILGFMTLNIESPELLSITNLYIIPEARGNNHFLQLLEYFNKTIEGLIAIKNPNRTLLEILAKTEICTTIANRFIISAVPFTFNVTTWEESIGEVFKYNSKLDETHPKIAMTSVYDKKLSAPILVNRSFKTLDSLENFKNEEYCLMAMSRYDDNKEDDCLKKRQSDKWIKSGKYFKKVVKLLNKSKLWI